MKIGDRWKYKICPYDSDPVGIIILLEYKGKDNWLVKEECNGLTFYQSGNNIHKRYKKIKEAK